MTVADYFFLAPVSAQGGTQDDGANVKVQAVFSGLATSRECSSPVIGSGS